MEFLLGENYRVTTDKYNYILQEKKITDPNHRLSKSDTPQERWVDIGYYGRIEHLINGLLNKEIKESEVNTLVEFKNFLNKLETRLATKIQDNL